MTKHQQMIQALKSNIIPEQIYKTTELYDMLRQSGLDGSEVQYHRVINQLLKANYLTRIHKGVYIKEFKKTDGEVMKCTLDKDINTCRFFDPELLECNNPKRCSFQDLIDTTNVNYEYQRPEKWFEKYYRK